MSIVREAYNPEKIEQIRKLLDMQIRKGLPVQFEIYIDSLTVVPKTNDINEFDTYEDYLSSGTRNMRLLIYDNISGTEQVNECLYKMSSYMNQTLPTPANNSLDGIELQDRINEQVNTKIAEIEFKRELKETKEQLKDAEATIDSLNNELEQERAKKGVEMTRWGEVGSLVLEGIIKRNPQLLSVLPGGENLAGIFMEQPEAFKDAAAPQPQATFREKAETEPKFSAQEQAFHNLFNALMLAFAQDRAGLVKVNNILNAIMRTPSLVHDIESLLSEPEEQPDPEAELTDNA